MNIPMEIRPMQSRRLAGIALIASMALVTACGGPDRVSRTTTTEQTTTAVPVQPSLGSTTTTTTEQTRQ